MEEIHTDAWESLKPFLDSLDEYVSKSVNAWTKYADEHKSSKAGRKFWSAAKYNMNEEIDSVLFSHHTRIAELLAAYQARMQEVAASWKGKHATYDIQGKIDELQTFADESLMGFKSKLGHSTKSGRKLSGVWDSYYTKKNGDYAAKKAEFEAKLAAYKAKIDDKWAAYKSDKKAAYKSKWSSWKTDHTAKSAAYKSKWSTWKTDHAAKSADYKSKWSSWKTDHAAKKADYKAKWSSWKTNHAAKSADSKSSYTVHYLG